MINQILQGDCLEVLKTLEDNSVDSIVSDPPYGISFMGKKWDYDVPKVEVWQEVLRVLKPGGHALVACGTRTQHRMAVNLEDAGFEIRDIVAWVYGSGFPKSLNIGKAVDKLQGNEREVVRYYDVSDIRGDAYGTMNDKQGGSYKNISVKETKGIFPYEGWGTALKPAMELWTLYRKPLEEKTVALNVLKYGTGGINIDGCRVGTEIMNNAPAGNKEGGNSLNMSKTGIPQDADGTTALGRFPANFIHDGSDEVVGLFPNSKSVQGKNVTRKELPNLAMSGKNYARFSEVEGYNDSGSASRFFYCAKASKSERNKGLEGFEIRSAGGLAGRADGSLGGEPVTNQNFHPTVKPIALMRYLCKLITPVGGKILDPFMGSGSTGIGAKLEGFDFIGIELDKDYCAIAEARIKSY